MRDIIYRFYNVTPVYFIDVLFYDCLDVKSIKIGQAEFGLGG